MHYIWATRRQAFVQKLVRVLFILSFLFLAFLGAKRLLSRDQQIISPLASEITKSDSLTFLFGQKPKDTVGLLEQIKTITSTHAGAFSVHISDLSDGAEFGLNETTIYTAASVNKIPILAALYYEAQRGEIDLDRRITLQASDIQDYGTGTLRYAGPGGSYSLKTLAQLLMEKSDNTAAYVLTTVLGESHIQELVNQWGLAQTDIKNNKTSNKDMALLMTKMYKGQIANSANTAEMIGFMDDTDFENRLPALLPKDVKVYHKIGNEIGNIHDVGIVELPKKSYYIGVFTNDIVNEAETEVVISQISKLVYDYMLAP